MGFYGNLYTNLTTFFHNVWFKGTAKNDESFLNNTDILTNTVTAQPVVAYDGLNINSGNRWIQFKSELDTIQNGAGGTNSAGITIYHAPPSGIDPEDVSNKTAELVRTPLSPEPEDDKFTNITENHANSMEKGGYLTTQTANYDKAGHLVSLTEKIFAFPDVDTVRDTANDAQARVGALEGQYTTLEARVGTAEATLRGLKNDDKTGTIDLLETKITNVEKTANEAKETADGLADDIEQAVSDAGSAKTAAEEAKTKSIEAWNKADGAVAQVSTFTDVVPSHQSYFDAIKAALTIIAETNAMSDVKTDLDNQIKLIRPEGSS